MMETYGRQNVSIDSGDCVITGSVGDGRCQYISMTLVEKIKDILSGPDGQNAMSHKSFLFCNRRWLVCPVVDRYHLLK